MATPAIPLTLAAAAAGADVAGDHTLAFYLLLLAVPAAAATAFCAAADFVEDARGALSAFAPTLVLSLLVLACAARSGGASVPRLATSAVGLALGVYALQALLALVPRPVRVAPARERA